MSLKNFAPGKPHLTDSIDGPPGLLEAFFVLRGEIDPEWVFIDGSYIRAHQHASGAQHGAERAIGLPRGGLSTKIHLAADAHGNPIDFEITGGEVQGATVAHKIINQAHRAENAIADKGYDSDEIRRHIRNRSAIPIIPRRSNSMKPNPEFDSHLYKHRHLVKNLFARLKHLKGIATRFEKLARNYRAIVYLVCSMIGLKLGK